MMKALVRKTKYGVQRLYKVVYRDSIDHTAPTFTTQRWAYSLDHLYEAFSESNNGDSWEIINTEVYYQ